MKKKVGLLPCCGHRLIAKPNKLMYLSWFIFIFSLFNFRSYACTEVFTIKNSLYHQSLVSIILSHLHDFCFVIPALSGVKSLNRLYLKYNFTTFIHVFFYLYYKFLCYTNECRVTNLPSTCVSSNLPQGHREQISLQISLLVREIPLSTSWVVKTTIPDFHKSRWERLH